MNGNSHQPLKERPAEEVGDPRAYERLLDRETVPVPAYLRQHGLPELGHADIPVDRYTSPEFFRLEAERLWPRVWQMVTREENLAHAGDHVVYDIVDDSVIVIRGDDGVIRGFINSCLHRGRALRSSDGSVSQLRCSYHGFRWDLQGALKSMPCVWDFTHLQRDQLKLPQVRVETWGGFVFLNFDAQAAPLIEYLGVIPEHFRSFPLQEYFTAVHVQKRVNCNWKAGQEAFVEALHVKGTHPAIMTFTGDVDSQYDVFDEHISRMITPFTVPSPNLADVPEERIVRDVLAMQPGAAAQAVGVELPPGITAREFIGEQLRQVHSAASGSDLSQATMAELQDAILYGVFPNTQIWGGYNSNIVYRFVPDGTDPDHCLFDIRILARVPPGAAKPGPAPLRRLADDESYTAVKEWGELGRVFDQDIRNLVHMTKGLKAAKRGKGAVSLANYQEIRIRHLHRTLDRYLGIGEAEPS